MISSTWYHIYSFHLTLVLYLKCTTGPFTVASMTPWFEREQKYNIEGVNGCLDIHCVYALWLALLMYLGPSESAASTGLSMSTVVVFIWAWVHDEKKCSKRLQNITIFEVWQSLKQTVTPKVLVVYMFMFLIKVFCSFLRMTFIYQRWIALLDSNFTD